MILSFCIYIIKCFQKHIMSCTVVLLTSCFKDKLQTSEISDDKIINMIKSINWISLNFSFSLFNQNIYDTLILNFLDPHWTSYKFVPDFILWWNEAFYVIDVFSAWMNSPKNSILLRFIMFFLDSTKIRWASLNVMTH